MPALSAHGVDYRYQNRYQTVDAVKKVTCEFEVGALYSIIGKSGSGKTTFLSLLAGLDLPTDGTILLDGCNIAKLDRNRYRRESVTVIYQNYNLFPLLTVLENVTYPLELRRVGEAQAQETAREYLRRVELGPPYEKRFPSMLSGGEQQRVAIARALTSGAKIILADEPTGNLDVENSRNIVSILRELAHEQGRCVIVVTHDRAVAEQSDIIYRMTDGFLTRESDTASME